MQKNEETTGIWADIPWLEVIGDSNANDFILSQRCFSWVGRYRGASEPFK